MNTTTDKSQTLVDTLLDTNIGLNDLLSEFEKESQAAEEMRACLLLKDSIIAEKDAKIASLNLENANIVNKINNQSMRIAQVERVKSDYQKKFDNSEIKHKETIVKYEESMVIIKRLENEIHNMRCDMLNIDEASKLAGNLNELISM
jgi:hypothetical protein